MAFSFGASAPATGGLFSGGLFGAPAASSASAFGASTAPAFGAASAPAFGASSASAFGASTAPAFGANATPAFGAAPPATSLFGAPASTAPATGLFGAAPATSTFGTTGLFGQQGSAPATSNALVPAGGLFGAPAQLQAQQQIQPAAQARAGLNYKTKFEELPPQMQQELQKIQQEISAYRDECKALDNDARLQDTVSIKQSLDSETAALRQTLQSLYQAAVADDEGLLAFRERVMVLVRSTETAVRLYQRSKLWREISMAPGPGGQNPLLSSQAVQDQLSQPVQLPNPYLQLAIRGFNDAIEQYHSCISELERVMPAAALTAAYAYGGGGGGDDASAVSSLPTLVSHMYDYFVHVAARLERLHKEVARAREAYLAQRRARGDYSDPFADARPIHHMPPGPGPAKRRPELLGDFGFYSFGGPAVSGGGGGASSTPSAPALGSSGTPAAPASGGGLFGLSPGPFGAPSSPFGAPAPGGNPAGAFGTPLMGAASQQAPQQQRVAASRAGSSSSKKR